jgi:hypothetical protein
MAAVFLATLSRIPTLLPSAIMAGSGRTPTCVARNRVMVTLVTLKLEPISTAVRKTNFGELHAS